MSDIAIAQRPSSRQGSPVPRRQLGSLSVNQRSYSRVSSKGGFGDESPLSSPLPYYPRHRSVTFAGDRSGAREERPAYNTAYAASAPVSPVRQRSPPPVSILKATSSFADDDDGAAAAVAGGVTAQGAAAAAAVPTATLKSREGQRRSPVPPRGRSASRQRLAARRREAQLHHSFYDDSFVEEFVLSAKSELEQEEAEQRRVEEQLRLEQERAKRAERRVSEAADKITALQHAKEVLMAATVRRHASVTPSPPRACADASKRNSSLLRELEEDPDPAVQEALRQLSRPSLAKPAPQQQQQRRRSLPIVSEDALGVAGSTAEEEEDDSDATEARKRAKLERIVSSVLARKGKSKSKRSVVVIDWSDIDSDGDTPNAESDAEDAEDAEEAEAVARRDAGRKRQRSQQSRRQSAAPPAEATVVASARAVPKAPSRRATSSRRRNVSVVPDLGDSLLFEEEEQPILLPRRTHQRPPPTRSLSHIEPEGDAYGTETEGEEAYAEASMERVVRRPPHATRAPAPRQRRGAVPSVAAAAAAAPPRGRRAPAASAAAAAAAEGAADTMAAPPSRARRAAAPRADPSDPMAVFFEAAFPSPSKFDEMMLHAGGLPETRRGAGGRGHGRQPNLVLPSSIGRRR